MKSIRMYNDEVDAFGRIDFDKCEVVLTALCHNKEEFLICRKNIEGNELKLVGDEGEIIVLYGCNWEMNSLGGGDEASFVHYKIIFEYAIIDTDDNSYVKVVFEFDAADFLFRTSNSQIKTNIEEHTIDIHSKITEKEYNNIRVYSDMKIKNSIFNSEYGIVNKCKIQYTLDKECGLIALIELINTINEYVLYSINVSDIYGIYAIDIEGKWHKIYNKRLGQFGTVEFKEIDLIKFEKSLNNWIKYYNKYRHPIKLLCKPMVYNEYDLEILYIWYSTAFESIARLNPEVRRIRLENINSDRKKKGKEPLKILQDRQMGLKSSLEIVNKLYKLGYKTKDVHAICDIRNDIAHGREINTNKIVNHTNNIKNITYNVLNSMMKLENIFK